MINNGNQPTNQPKKGRKTMKKLTRISAIIKLLKKWDKYEDFDFSGNNAIYTCKTRLNEQQKKIIRSREGVKILVSKTGDKNAVLVSI